MTFYVPSTTHDCSVVGDALYVSLHLTGADHYAGSEILP